MFNVWSIYLKISFMAWLLQWTHDTVEKIIFRFRAIGCWQSLNAIETWKCVKQLSSARCFGSSSLRAFLADDRRTTTRHLSRELHCAVSRLWTRQNEREEQLQLAAFGPFYEIDIIERNENIAIAVKYQMHGDRIDLWCWWKWRRKISNRNPKPATFSLHVTLARCWIIFIIETANKFTFFSRFCKISRRERATTRVRMDRRRNEWREKCIWTRKRLESLQK